MNKRIQGSTTDAPPQAGPYSQSVRIGNIVACAGQAGFTPAGELLDGVPAQTRQTLKNIEATLAAVGSNLDEVAHVRVYLTDPSQFAEMNAEYESLLLGTVSRAHDRLRHAPRGTVGRDRRDGG